MAILTETARTGGWPRSENYRVDPSARILEGMRRPSDRDPPSAPCRPTGHPGPVVEDNNRRPASADRPARPLREPSPDREVQTLAHLLSLLAAGPGTPVFVAAPPWLQTEMERVYADAAAGYDVHRDADKLFRHLAGETDEGER